MSSVFKKLKISDGFTMMELVITTIFVGILAALSIYMMMHVVAYNVSAEALTQMGSIRRSAIRCYRLMGNSYNGCSFATIDIDDPNVKVVGHFDYYIYSYGVPASDSLFTPDLSPDVTAPLSILAERNSFEGGDGTSEIMIEVFDDAIVRIGSGVFSAIK